ncbi:MAG: restriction endonuclease subunit S [Candidatus Caldatribacteriota bacterium]
MNENMKVPEGWKMVRLGEIITENSKSPFKVEEAGNQGSFPFFTSGEGILRHSKFLIDNENIFISTGGTAYVKYYNGKSSYSADTYSLKSKINTLYLYYFIYRKLNHITFRYFIGSGLEHLQKQDFKNSFEVIFPIDPNEQQKIAEILETVDRAIEKTDKIIEKYKRIKQGLMQDLLTKGIDENGKIRSEKTHKFKNSPLGRIPEDWEVVRLGEVSEIKGGKRLPKGEELIDEGHPYIRLVDIEGIRVNASKVKYIPEKIKQLISRYVVSKNDVILSIAGTIGLVALIPNELDGANLTENAVKITNLKNLDKNFLAFILSNYLVQRQINMLTGVVAQPKLALFRLATILISLPPLPEQQRIAEILSQIDNTIEKEEAYKQKLESIKKGLMEDLLT